MDNLKNIIISLGVAWILILILTILFRLVIFIELLPIVATLCIVLFFVYTIKKLLSFKNKNDK